METEEQGEVGGLHEGVSQKKKLIPEPGHRYGRIGWIESEVIQNAKETLPLGEKFAILKFLDRNGCVSYAWHWPSNWDFNKLHSVISVKVCDV